MLRTLLTAGGVELIESPDRLCSMSVVPGGDKDGGLTEDSWTFQKIERKKENYSSLLKIYTLALTGPTDTFLIAYKPSELFTWHSGFQTLLRNLERCQGCDAVDNSPSCHFWPLNTSLESWFSVIYCTNIFEHLLYVRVMLGVGDTKRNKTKLCPFENPSMEGKNL